MVSGSRSLAVDVGGNRETPRPRPPGAALALHRRMGNLLWGVIVILVILWLAGFALHIGGSLIHALIVIAVIVLLFQLITGRRAV